MNAQKIQRRPRTAQGRWRTRVAIALCFVLGASACGTRVSQDAIVAASGGVPGTIAPGSPTASAGTEGQVGEIAADVVTSAPTEQARAGGTSAPGAAAPKFAAAGGGGAAGCTKTGSPLIIGQNTTISGLVGQNVNSAVPGLAAWAQHVNAQGGLACHPVKLTTLDDGSSASRASGNVRELKARGAQVLVGNFVPVSFPGFKSAVDAEQIPAIGGDQIVSGWNEDPLLYAVGAGEASQNWAGMAAIAATGANKVAVIYCVEAAACSDFRNTVVDGVGAAGASVVYEAQVSLTQVDYTAECQNAKRAGATQIVIAVEGSGIQRLARSCVGIGYVVPMVAQGLAAGFNNEDGPTRQMTVTLAGAGFPWFLSDTPAQAEFQSAIKRYAPNAKLSGAASQAWNSGMMLKAAIDKLGPEAVANDLTSALIIKGLGLIKNETLGGLAGPTSYAPGQPSKLSRCAFVVTLDRDGKWKSPLGNDPKCRP